LVRLASPLAELDELVSSLRWDCDGPIVELTAELAKHVLALYLSGEIGVAEVEHWANLVESREDISATPNVRQVIFTLANPALEGLLNPESAAHLIRILSA
jgi:hypothetical protein